MPRIKRNFNEAYHEYKTENPYDLIEWINSVKKVNGMEWFYLMELMIDIKTINIRMGDFYIKDTIDIFQQGLEKTSLKEGKISFDRRLGVGILSENPEKFRKFMDLYKEKANHTMPWVSVLLNWQTHKAEFFWEKFHDDIVKDMKSVKEGCLLNFMENVNLIFDLDKSQHKNIQNFIEFDKSYPTGNTLENILIYSINFSNYILPRHPLNQYGRNDKTILSLKEIETTINKEKLAVELNNSKTKQENKENNKARNKI